MSWTVFSICYSSGPVVTSIDFLIRPRWVSDALISRENIYSYDAFMHIFDIQMYIYILLIIMITIIIIIVSIYIYITLTYE